MAISSPNTDIRDCEPKHGYSKAKAKVVARRFGQRIYFCKVCKLWHLTSVSDLIGNMLRTRPYRRRDRRGRLIPQDE